MRLSVEARVAGRPSAYLNGPIVAIASTMLLIVAKPVLAADAYLDAYSKGDYATALKIVLPQAESGNAIAQSNLGVMYEQGQGVAQNYEQAVSWYRKAADQGNARAQLNLGIMYLNGRGVPKDDDQAVTLYRKAADQGDILAQDDLGWAYANGRGIPQDDKAAAEWWRKCALQGSGSCQAELASAIDNGRGIAQNHREAMVWYQKAASQGDVNAKSIIARTERATTRFTSFENAQTLLRPESGLDISLMQNAMTAGSTGRCNIIYSNRF